MMTRPLENVFAKQTLTTIEDAIRQIVELGGDSKVALWGACGDETWRFTDAIPFMEKAGLKYFNPQIDNWTPEHATKEFEAFQDSDYHMYVIGKTRGTVSAMELILAMLTGRVVIPVIQFLEVGSEIEGHTVTSTEAKTINEIRSKIARWLTLLGLPTFSSVEDALKNIPLAMSRPDLFRIKGLESARQLLCEPEYQCEEETFILLPSDPLNYLDELAETLFSALISTNRMTITVPVVNWASGAEHGITLDPGSRIYKDFSRCTDPYLWEMIAQARSDVTFRIAQYVVQTMELHKTVQPDS